MRRIWNLFTDEKEKKQQNHQQDATKEEGSDGDETVEVTHTGTMSKEASNESASTPEAGTPLMDERSVDEGEKKKKKPKRRSKPTSRSKEATTPTTPKTSLSGKKKKRNRQKEGNSRRRSHTDKKDDDGAKQMKVAEAREENKADDEEFENDGKSMARSKIKTRDLNWKKGEDASTPTRSADKSVDTSESRSPAPRKQKIVEAREENKADDEEFENDGKSMARSKIKTRDLQWKNNADRQVDASPGKGNSGSDSGGDSTEKKQKKKPSPAKPRVAEARDENKADDEEFENDGKSMARSKIKTRDLKWKEEEKKPVITEARDENKADDEEFENDGKSMARSKIKTRDLNWKKNEEASTPTKSMENTDRSEARSPMRKEKEETASSTPEKREKSTSDSPDPPTRSVMQQLQPKKELPPSVYLPAPASPASPSPSPPHVQSTVRLEVKEAKETKVDKSTGKSRHATKKEESAGSNESDKSFMRKLRPKQLLRLSHKSKSRHESTKSAHEQTKPVDKGESSPSLPSPDKSSRESSKSSKRLDVVASAADKSMRSIKSIFKKTDDTKKRWEELLPHIERDARDVQDARRLMEMLKRNNVFENALFPSQNECLRAHFLTGSRKMEKATMDLLFKAADFVLDKILYRGEELDEYIDNTLKTFILNRTKSRTMVVEHLLRHPEFLPQTWGGRTVVLTRSEEETIVAPEDEKSKKEPRSKRQD